MNLSTKNLVIFFVGAGIGYLGSRVMLEKKYILQASNDIADAEEFYRNKYGTSMSDKSVEEDVSSLMEVKEAAEALAMYQGGGSSPLSTKPRAAEDQPRTHVAYNVPVKSETTLTPTATKTPVFNEPFVISADDFVNSEFSVKDQVQICYYDGDGVVELMDSGDICSKEYVSENLGDPTKFPFGHKSGDPDLIYIRCEQHSIDFEVFRSARKYSEKHEEEDVE